VAVKVTGQDDVPIVVEANMQGFPVKLPVTPFWVNETVPVGLVGEAELSLTVAVHVVGVFVFTGEGEQITAMSVGCARFTVSAAVPELVV
jgi:hypothetical protein